MRAWGTFAIALVMLPVAAWAQAPSEKLVLSGLTQPVEILKDRWGISHIYAQNENDVFFAQGYNAARDLLCQLELWPPQATGTHAEHLRARELKRDIGRLLLQCRACQS